MSVLQIHNPSDCDLVPLSLVHNLSLTLRTQCLFVSTSLRVSIIDLDVSLSTHVTVSQLTVEVVVGRWFLSIEVVKGNISVEQGDGVFDSGQVSNDGPGF